MENSTEIMNDEQVIKTAEEVAESANFNGLVLVAGVGIMALVDFAAYKYIGKPIYNKIRKKDCNVTPIQDGIEDADFVDVDDKE